MNAILVSVDYTDILRLTLPRNRHHFERVLVVTSRFDLRNVEPIARANSAEVFMTDSFYFDGADFNKFRALEEGLDYLGRTGWICIMDADIVWPDNLTWWRNDVEKQEPGTLYTPHRRIANPVPQEIPPEEIWRAYPMVQTHSEFAGYTQVFHANDPVLGPSPWHQLDWRHAGGADSFFQARWDVKNKVRPPFEVLHLGPCGTNWCGTSDDDRAKLHHYMWERTRTRSMKHERL